MHFCSRVHVHRLLQIFCSSRASSFLFLDFWKRKNSKRAREESEIYQGVGTWNAAIPNPKRRERVGGCRRFLCSDGGRDLCESILYLELYLQWIMNIILKQSCIHNHWLQYSFFTPHLFILDQNEHRRLFNTRTILFFFNKTFFVFLLLTK